MKLRWLVAAWWICCVATAAAPLAVGPGVFDPALPDLGLKPAPGTQNITVFKPDAGTDGFANGVVLFPFRGRLYAQWQSSQKDEDSPDTHVVYATSADGVHWTRPKRLGTTDDAGMQTSGGWWADGQQIIAFINVWPEGFRRADGSHPGGLSFYRQSRDGVHWSGLKPVTGLDGKPVPGIIEQDPHRLPTGRIVTAFHLRPGLIAAPFYTDDPRGVSGWVRGAMANLPHDGDVSRELEPSLYRKADGCLVMLFRDEGGSFRLLVAQSCDGGAHWTTPVVTDFPDARAKLSAGNLPDGTAYLINAPSGTKLRVPLALSLSRDGETFRHSFLLRGGADAVPPRFDGRYKRAGFHYPKSVVWNGWLYVGYSIGKEDVAITRVPLASLK